MENLNFLVVFLEGMLSLFSPCVLPIIPVYIAILTGSTGDGEDQQKGKKPIINTILFILGISTTFFILGSTINYFSNFLFKNKDLMNVIGGILIILMGLFFMGFLKLPGSSGNKTKSKVQGREMGPLTAFLLGFTFSWGWSPCVGPMLASAIIMASNTGSSLQGNLMILVYTLGFVLPFLIIAIFYEKLSHHLDKLNEHSDKIKKIGGILLIVTGLLMAVGGMDKFANIITDDQDISLEEEMDGQEDFLEEEDDRQPAPTDGESQEEPVPAIDFTLEDQYGNSHSLSDYKGKVVFLNFWATWCPPCVKEMPDLEEIYQERGLNQEDVVILGLAAPDLGKEKSKEEIIEFLEEKDFNYPVVFDLDGEIMMKYQISSFPTSFVIDQEGNIEGYIPGMIPKDFMEEVIDNTLAK